MIQHFVSGGAPWERTAPGASQACPPGRAKMTTVDDHAFGPTSRRRRCAFGPVSGGLIQSASTPQGHILHGGLLVGGRPTAQGMLSCDSDSSLGTAPSRSNSLAICEVVALPGLGRSERANRGWGWVVAGAAEPNAGTVPDRPAGPRARAHPKKLLRSPIRRSAVLRQPSTLRTASRWRPPCVVLLGLTARSAPSCAPPLRTPNALAPPAP